ncbi:NAD(P)/FAD-dependent oxidoreductase [Oceanibacterium hippocampi]|uniref:Hydrogen cyanide synthase subunit HcnC n=1 Tax=Oceanibacterium hippocampi TaxID=745714 RepID=A0A1Y5TES9_9PROT|nr:FAD-binding oxidoreductase [Oceanibacterium hippocampi]SLN62614.1 Hydrogen cyanide synthase subunit HcnC precursor [Oceanibacterium hippocampi]
MSETADILVIGGGIAGISAAARMAPEASVIVLEAEDTIGRHATGRSAAIFILNYGNMTLRALNLASESELLEPVGISDRSLLSPRGEMLIASEADMPAFEAYLAGSVGMDRLTPKEAVELFPLLRPEPIFAAAIERNAQEIDVDRLLQGFARLLRHHGGKIVPEARAETIVRRDGVWHVETPAGSFEAPILVNAAGAWADEVAATAGLRRLGLMPLRRSAAIVPLPDGQDSRSWPMVASAAENWYAKPEGGKLMVSPADEDLVEPHDAWPDDMVLAEGLDRFEKAMTMEVTRVERTWAGLRTFAPDRSPVVGFAPDGEGFLWLAGQGGYGVQTSPALSRLAADIALGRQPVLGQQTVAAVAPARFF